LLAETRLAMSDENLYSAHEVVQMIPLYGMEVYGRFRELNRWAWNYMPNAGATGNERNEHPLFIGKMLKRLGEHLLGGRIGRAVERWEGSRKIKKLYASVPLGADDVEFSADVCRGFTSGHGRRVQAEFEGRVSGLRSAIPSTYPAQPVLSHSLVSAQY
jgi:hypothetical protein